MWNGTLPRGGPETERRIGVLSTSHYTILTRKYGEYHNYSITGSYSTAKLAPGNAVSRLALDLPRKLQFQDYHQYRRSGRTALANEFVDFHRRRPELFGDQSPHFIHLILRCSEPNCGGFDLVFRSLPKCLPELRPQGGKHVFGIFPGFFKRPC